MNTSLIILILTILAAFFAWINSSEDTKQKNRIEDLGRINQNLTTEVKQLANLNNQIASKTDAIVSENKDLAQKNIELTNKANVLIEKVQDLTVQTNVLINKIDIKTDQEFSVTGEFDFKISDAINENIVFLWGESNKHIINLNELRHFSQIRTEKPGIRLNFYPIYVRLVNDNLLLSCTVYDVEGNVIVEVRENKWRINKKLLGRFNYDGKGFEVIDDNGMPLMSIDMKQDNSIMIQGVLLDFEQNRTTIIGYNKSKSYAGIGFEKGKFSEIMSDVQILRLFEYLGSKWHGVRKNQLIGF